MLVWSYPKKKMSKWIGILHKAKKILGKDSLQTLYNCFIYPYIIYCIKVLAAASLKNLMTVLRLQKRPVRLIALSSFRAHSEPLFLSLQVLSVFDVYSFRLSIILFRYENDPLPYCANSMFTKIYIHGYCTQQVAWLPFLFHIFCCFWNVNDEGIHTIRWCPSPLQGDNHVCVFFTELNQCFGLYFSAIKNVSQLFIVGLDPTGSQVRYFQTIFGPWVLACTYSRDQSRYVPSQWETLLHCNVSLAGCIPRLIPV